MNRISKTLASLVLGFAALGLVAAVPASSQAAPLELKLGHIQTEQDFWHLGSLKFKEELEKRSNGEITLKIYPNSTLGGDRDLVEGMQMGTVDFGLVAGVLGNFEKSIGLLELPYLFDSQEEFNKVIHGPIGEEIASRMVKTSGMGANPTPMAWSEVYTGLQQNVIEAQENPIPFIYGGRINEVQKYIAITDHKYEYVTIAMSEMRWKKLNDKQRQIIVEAANAATADENQLVLDKTNELLAAMQAKGLQVTHPDKKELAAAARSVHEDFAKTVDLDLYKRILQTLGR